MFSLIINLQSTIYMHAIPLERKRGSEFGTIFHIYLIGLYHCKQSALLETLYHVYSLIDSHTGFVSPGYGELVTEFTFHHVVFKVML
jgi:hypothetical protein